jgi:uncharacterized protein (DUF1330 family)
VTAYAVAHLTHVEMNDEVVEYLRRINGTLAGFGGKFLIHGGQVHELEADWPGHLVMISFPDLAGARAWYDSPSYQAILPLRLRNSAGSVILVEGVTHPHQATDILPGKSL